MPTISAAAALETAVRQHLPRRAQVEVQADPVSMMYRVRRLTFHADTGERMITEYAVAVDHVRLLHEPGIAVLAQHIASQLSRRLERDRDPDPGYDPFEDLEPVPLPHEPSTTLWEHLLGS